MVMLPVIFRASVAFGLGVVFPCECGNTALLSMSPGLYGCVSLSLSSFPFCLIFSHTEGCCLLGYVFCFLVLMSPTNRYIPPHPTTGIDLFAIPTRCLLPFHIFPSVLSCLPTPVLNPHPYQTLVSSGIAMKSAAVRQATKYLLRAGEIPKAEQTIAIFTRHEGDPQHNLFEMQCRYAVLAAAAVLFFIGCLLSVVDVVVVGCLRCCC